MLISSTNGLPLNHSEKTMTFDEYLDFLEEYWTIFPMPEHEFNPDHYRDMRL